MIPVKVKLMKLVFMVGEVFGWSIRLQFLPWPVVRLLNRFNSDVARDSQSIGSLICSFVTKFSVAGEEAR